MRENVLLFPLLNCFNSGQAQRGRCLFMLLWEILAWTLEVMHCSRDQYFEEKNTKKNNLLLPIFHIYNSFMPKFSWLFFFVSLFIEISHPPLLFFHTASVLVLSLTVKDVIASVLGRNLDQDNSAEDIVQSNNFHYPISAQSLVCCYSLNEFFF